MPELHSPDWEPIRALIPSAQEAGHTTFAHAVLDGTLPGRVFVDDAEAPGAALICPDCGFFLAVGDPRVDFVDALVPELARDSTERPNESRLLVASSPGWEAALDTVFATKERRFEYRFGPVRLVSQMLSRGFRIVTINETIARQFGFGIDAWVIRTWGGPHAFIQRSFGVAVLAGDDLAAICAACALGGGEAEIEIATDPRFRRRGLAVAAAQSFFRECQSRSLTPAWTCAAENTASVQTAARLGFLKLREVAIYPLRPYFERIDGRWEIPARG